MPGIYAGINSENGLRLEAGEGVASCFHLRLQSATPIQQEWQDNVMVRFKIRVKQGAAEAPKRTGRKQLCYSMLTSAHKPLGLTKTQLNKHNSSTRTQHRLEQHKAIWRIVDIGEVADGVHYPGVARSCAKKGSTSPRGAAASA